MTCKLPSDASLNDMVSVPVTLASLRYRPHLIEISTYDDDMTVFEDDELQIAGETAEIKVC